MAKRIIVDVLYTNGDEASYPVRPIALVAAEREYATKTGNTELEMTLWAAWWGIQGEKATFDAWLKSLDAVEQKTTVAAPLENSPVEASTPTSSSSLPEPVSE